MTGTPAERAAILSARIHKALNTEGAIHVPDFAEPCRDIATPEEFADFVRGCLGFREFERSDVFSRLGLEMRRISIGNSRHRETLGNREGRR